MWREEPPETEIRLTDGGFSVVKKRTTIVSVSWDEIDEIVAFKRDLFTTDLICFAFAVAGKSFEVNEETPGFSSLVNALELRFPTFDRKWYGKVFKPAFERNKTVIYTKYWINIPGTEKIPGTQ